MLNRILRAVGLKGQNDEEARACGATRSPHWPAVEKEFLRNNPTCACCGSKTDLNVHHKEPFHLHPDRELDPKNLITLCRPHHLLVGHLMNWASFNLNVETDAALWLKKIQHRPAGTRVAAAIVLALLVAALSLGVCAAADPPHAISREGGPVLERCTENKGAELTAPLPGPMHIANIGSKLGNHAGMCVCTSIEMAALWHGMDDWKGFRNWCAERYEGGGWPDKVQQLITAYAKAKGIPVPPFYQYQGDDPGPVLKLCDCTGRMACIAYGYSPRYAGGPWRSAGYVNHMVCCPLYDKVAAVLDNNFIGETRYEWQPCTELVRRMKLGSADDYGRRPVKVQAWVFVWLTPPPPPIPFNGAKK